MPDSTRPSTPTRAAPCAAHRACDIDRRRLAPPPTGDLMRLDGGHDRGIARGHRLPRRRPGSTARAAPGCDEARRRRERTARPTRPPSGNGAQRPGRCPMRHSRCLTETGRFGEDLGTQRQRSRHVAWAQLALDPFEVGDGAGDTTHPMHAAGTEATVVDGVGATA